MRLRIAAVLSLLLCSTSFGWSTKEHIQLTRLAIEGLLADPATPDPMKQWLRKAAPGLPDAEGEKAFLLNARIGVFPRGETGIPFWATVPDLEALTGGLGDGARKVEPYNVPERQLHYIDLEYFFPDDANRKYADDLSHKPAFKDIPRDMSEPRWQRAGMLPFRVDECYRQLVLVFRKGRLNDAPGQFPRDEHAEKWAGMLAHYAEDNTQPQHSTADYKSQSYFKDKLRGPNVHADMEYILVDDDYADYRPLREEFWTELQKALADFRDPIQSDDPWTATVEVSLASYNSLPLIGHAAVAAYSHEGSSWKFDAEKFYRFKGPVDGREMTVIQMKAKQMAWGVKRVQRLWRRAWDEAHAGGK